MSQYPQLDEAFSKLRSEGVSNEKIKEGALKQGWSIEDIDSSLSTLPLAPEATSIPPSQPTSEVSSTVDKSSTALSTPHTSSLLKKLVILLCVIIVLGLLGGAALYAYSIGFNPFAKAPYVEASFTSSLFTKLSEIQSGESKIKVSVYTQPRDSDATPFKVEMPNKEELDARYKRDYDRVEAISDITRELHNANYFNEASEPFVFPVSLEAFRLSLDPGSSVALRGFPVDPLSKQPFVYKQTKNGSDYELIATFETQEAIDQIRERYTFSDSGAQIDGMQVTFTKDSPSFLFISQELPKSLFEQVADFASLLSEDFSFSGELTALKEKPEEGKKSSSGSIEIDFQGDLDDLSYHVNAEARVVEGTYYFIVNNFPIGFIPKDRWISWTPGETQDENAFIDVGQWEEKYRNSQDVYNRYVDTVIRLADKNGLIEFKNEPKRERIDGQTLYRYDLALRKDAVVQFYASLIEAVKNDPEFKEFAQLTTEHNLELLQSEAFSDIFEYYTKNTSLFVWMTPEGVPVKITYTMRVVPPDENTRMKDSQVMVELTSAFSRVNEDIKIVAPEEARSYKEVFDEMLSENRLGGSVTRSTDAVIKSIVSNARAQAEISGFQADGTTDYSGVCSNSMMVGLLSDIESKSAKPYCNSTLKTWVVSAPLKEGGFICVDSTGYSQVLEGENMTSGQICPL